MVSYHQLVQNDYAGTIPVVKADNDLVLYPHQREALHNLTEFLNQKEKVKGLLVIPTGGGKTLTAMYWVLKNAINQGKKVLWIAHRHELLNQALNSALQNANMNTLTQKESFNYRIISGLHDKPIHIQSNDDLLIASKDSLLHGINHVIEHWIKPNKNRIFVVVDEAHHAGAKSYRRLLEQLDKANGKTFHVLGLTATPFRTAEREKSLLSKIFPNDILYGVDLRTLISRGILSDPIFEELETPLEMTKSLTDKEIKQIEAFDLPTDIATQIAESSERNNFIVEHYVKNQNKYGRLLVFAVNIVHALALSSLFQKRGISSDYIVSDITDMDRKISVSSRDNAEKLQRFRDGELQVLVNVDILTEGTDLPSVQTVFLTRPTTSTILMTQMIGRALRGEKAGGTASAYIVSFVDRWRDKIAWVNPQRLIEDEHEWNDTKDREKRVHIMRLIAIQKMEEFARVMDDSINTDAIESRPFMERIPVGLYSFSLLIPDSKGEWVNKLCDILVYDNMYKGFMTFTSELESIFADIQIGETETISEDALADLSSDIQIQYFEDSVSREDIEDILRYYSLNGVSPDFLELKDRENYDVTKIAQYIWDNDLGEKSKASYLNSIWNEDKSFWKVFFANKEKYFIRQVQIDLDKLAHPGLYEKTSQPDVIHETINITQLSLEELRKRNYDYWKELIEGIYAKSKDKDGYYHSAISDYKSKNRLNFQIDHIQPLSQGGLSVLENLQLITRWENAKKGDTWQDDGRGQNLNKEFNNDKSYLIDETTKGIDKIYKLIEDGEVETALYKINQELESGVEKEEYYLIKADILAEAEQFEEAFASVDIAMRLFPQSPRSNVAKGNLLVDKEKWNEAEEEYLKGLAKDSDNEKCLFNLGLIYEVKEDYKQALQYYNKVIDINPSDSQSYLRKGIIWPLMHPRKKGEALELINKAIELDTQNAETYFEKGELLNSWNQYTDALKCYEIAKKYGKDDIDTLAGKAYALENLKNYDEAIKAYKELIEREPTDAYSHFQIAWILDKQKKFNEAIASYQKYIDMEPEDAMAYNNMGYTLYKMRKFDEALNAYNEALRIDPEHSYARRNKRNLLKKMEVS